MNYIELKINDIQNECQKLYDDISKNYDYDLVIFIAKGAYIIGENMASFNKVPLLEIRATRVGNSLKKYLSFFLKFVPKKLLIKLREKEMKSSIHEKKVDRKISFNKKLYRRYENCKKILLVDDSIDTGNSIILCKKELERIFLNAEIKVAVFNIMNKSTFKDAYYLYQDYMISGPWSSDSKENKLYLKMYDDWVKQYENE